MDANGLRFWMLSSKDDWQPLVPAPDAPAGVWYCEDRARLQLRSSPSAPPAPEHFATAQTLLALAPFARDSYDNVARWDASTGHVMVSGSGPGELPLYTPPPLVAVTDLALGYDGILYVVVGGQLVFIDRRSRWPNFTLEAPNLHAFRLVPHPDGGVLVLDRETPELVRVRGAPLGDLPPRAAAPGIFRAVEENADPPRITEIVALPVDEAFVALAADGGDNFALLSWHRAQADNDAVWLRTFTTLAEGAKRQLLRGVSFPYSLAWLSPTRIAVLASENKQPFVYDLDPTLDALDPVGDSYVLTGVNAGPFAHGFTAPPYYSYGTDLFPLIPLALNAFSESGSALQGRVIDSGRARTEWHRLFLEAVLPPRCGVVVWLAAAETPVELDALKSSFPRGWYPHRFGAAPALDAFSAAPLAAWQRSPSEVPLHPGLLGEPPVPGQSGLFMTLVQRANVAVRTLRGRYLGVRLDLSGDRRATPEIAALRIYGSRFSYVEHYLPEIYRENTFGPEGDVQGESTRPDFFERFVNIFEAELTKIEDRVASVHVLTDAGSTPDTALDWLGSWLGVEPEPEPSDRRRARLSATPKLRRKRGTLEGIGAALDIATGGMYGRGAIILLEDYRLRHTFATILGADLSIQDDPLLPGYSPSSNSFVGETLFLGDEHHPEFLALFRQDLASVQDRPAVEAFLDSLAHRLTIFVHDQVEAVDQKLVLRVVEREKPAHVAVSLKRASEPFLVGLASLLGVNTYLAPKPPRELARVDRSRIGRAFIEELPALDPRFTDAGAGERFADPIARLRAPAVVLSGQPIPLDGAASLAPEGTQITNYRWTLLPNT